MGRGAARAKSAVCLFASSLLTIAAGRGVEGAEPGGGRSPAAAAGPAAVTTAAQPGHGPATAWSIDSTHPAFRPQTGGAPRELGVSAASGRRAALDQRLAALRAGRSESVSGAPPTAAMLTDVHAGNDLGPLLAGLGVRPLFAYGTERGGLWLRSFGEFGGAAREGDHEGYGYFQGGTVAGLDRRIDRSAIVGGHLSYSEGHAGYDEERGSLDVDRLGIGAHASLFEGTRFLNASTTATLARHETARHARYGQLDRTAWAEYESYGLSIGLSGGATYLSAPWRITPTGAIDAAWGVTDAYAESGAGALGLAVAPHSDAALRTRLGVNVGHEVALEIGRITPYAGLSWSMRSSLGDTELLAAGDDGEWFAVETRDETLHSLTPALGVRAEFGHGTSASAGYVADMAGGVTVHRLAARVRLAW